jgi:hypothetical protein
MPKCPILRPTRRENDIKIVLRKIGCNDGKWTGLADDRFQWQIFDSKSTEIPYSSTKKTL